MHWHDICVIYLVTNEYNLKKFGNSWVGHLDQVVSDLSKTKLCNIGETSLGDLFYKLAPLIGYGLLGVVLDGHLQAK